MSSISGLSSQTATVNFSNLWRSKKIESNFEGQSVPSIGATLDSDTNANKPVSKGDCVLYIPELDVYRLPEYMKGIGSVVERPMALIIVHEKDLNQFNLENEENIAKNLVKQSDEYEFLKYTYHQNNI